jgi:hypothetical protein
MIEIACVINIIKIRAKIFSFVVLPEQSSMKKNSSKGMD